MSVEKRLEELTAEFNQLNGQKQGLVAQMQKIDTRLITSHAINEKPHSKNTSS